MGVERDPDILVVARLREVAGSLAELVRVLDQLGQAGRHLVAEDVGLDTRTPAGRRMAGLLREVERWERERPRGRPGIAHLAPHVAERISELREHGLSLHAIAAQLNAEGVPTPRGGTHWRASSVQAALGYRRPKPPPPPRGLGGPGPPEGPRKRPDPKGPRP